MLSQVLERLILSISLMEGRWKVMPSSQTIIDHQGLSTFSTINDATHSLINNQREIQKSHKSKINDHQKHLKQKREERLQNLEDRLRQVSQNHKGCMKSLRVISIVITSLAGFASMGTALPGLGGALSAMKIASKTIFAISESLNQLIGGLEELKEASQQKKLLINEAHAKEILAIIQETEKWIEEEKEGLKTSQKKEKRILEEHQSKLIELEKSYQSMLF